MINLRPLRRLLGLSRPPAPTFTSSTHLNLIGGGTLDLSVSEEFNSYYNRPETYTKHIIDKEINKGHYHDRDFLKIFENKNAIVVDGGANIGLFSLLVCRSSRQVHAIEPTKQHLNVLRALINYYNLHNIVCHEIALNNYNGKCHFMFEAGNSTMNKISSKGAEVPCCTIASFLSNNRIDRLDVLKLDIEGGERLVVLEDQSFSDIKAVCQNIYIEIHPPYAHPKDIIKTISNMGFKYKYVNSPFLNNNLNVLFYRDTN